MKKLAEQKDIKPTPFFSFKKPWIWILIVLVVAAAVTTVLLLTRQPVSTDLPEDMDAFIVSTLRDQHYSDHTAGKYPAVAYTTLAVEEEDDVLTVYGVMMYREYTCTTKNKLQAWGSANDPFAITAKKTDQGYELVECWWPKSGKDYITSIEEKFPKKVLDNATNPQQYFTAHVTACETAALQEIADTAKYTVYQSSGKNVRLGYCTNNDCAYILFGGGSALDGHYTMAEGKASFTFGTRTIVFDVEEDSFVFKLDESTNVPAEWGTIGDTTYFKDGIHFTPEDAEVIIPNETAPIGPTVIVTSNTWLDETGLRELFGQYVPSTYFSEEGSKYLPVKPVETRAQLDRLIEMFGDNWSGLTMDAFAQYDDAFFKDNYLMMTYYRDGMAAAEPKIASYEYVEDGETLWMSVRLEVTRPSEGDTVVGQWLLFSGIAKADYDKVNALEAYVEKEITKETATAATNLSFTGTVTQVEGNAMLMSCDGVEQFSNGVWVELGQAELDPMVGETYTVTYEDLVMPSLPPRITAVTITKN